MKTATHARLHQARAGWQTSDQLLIGVVAALAGLAAVLWATGELAGRLFGDGSPATKPTELVAIALRFAGSLDDPAAAWPESGRDSLPGPLAFHTSASSWCWCSPSH